MLWFRVQIVLVFLVPVLLFAGLFAFGQAIPIPHLGRDYVIRIELPDPGTGLDLPPIEGPDDASRPLVVIDAGHGGHDPGAVSSGFQEKAVVLGLSRNLRDQLLSEGGIRVALTRDTDRYLALAERVQIARELGADLFLSIHADSAGGINTVRGASTYTLSDEANSEAAARFAQRENEADIVNGTLLSGETESVNSILVELSQRRTADESAEFVDLIIREGAREMPFHSQPRRSAELGVLRAPDVPSVLFEAGFLTNPAEAIRLTSAEGQQAFAQSMARAIRIYFARSSNEAT